MRQAVFPFRMACSSTSKETGMTEATLAERIAEYMANNYSYEIADADSDAYQQTNDLLLENPLVLLRFLEFDYSEGNEDAYPLITELKNTMKEA